MPRTVRDVMTKLVVVAPIDAGYTDLVRLMHDYRVSALPIVGDDGAIAGIVSEADLLRKGDPDLFEWHLLEGPHRRAERRKAAARTARDLMTSPAVVIAPTATTAEAAHEMRRRNLKHLPVVDDRGHVLGVVSRVDLLAVFLRGDDAIREDVVDLVRRAHADASAVDVAVVAGVVRMEGTVGLRSDHERLVDRARSIDGVVDVEADRLDFIEDDTLQPVSPVPWVGF
ncbi:MAG TPA: CBS domain-containing protein [Actinomycetota bacterium]|nr:CBS domain-containing protein [Actinomycetota bacterium]